MKNNPVVFSVLHVGVLLLFLFNCKKEAMKVAPTVTIAEATNVTTTTATSGGEITSDGGASVTSRGVCWSANQNPTTQDTKTSNSTGTGSFTSSLTGLTPGATYYLKAYATNSIGTAYSSQLSLTTMALAPVLTTTAVSAITSSTATSGGIISSNGGAAVTVSGVCWGTSTNPTTALSTKTTDGLLTGTFTGSITGLTPGTTYYVRAYATNSIGTGYGNEITVTTTAVIPVLTTTAASAILSTTATSGGVISSNGGAAVTVSGVCWGTSTNPTTALSTKTTDGLLTGTFTGSITGLTPGTIYYVRAYATNSAGTGYGSEVNFTTTYSYTVVLASNPSAGGITTGGGTFNSGASVTVTAVANAGYTFTNWTESGTAISTTASYTFTISGNRTLVANYSPITYTLAVSSNPLAGGTTTGGGTFNSGASVTVNAVANAGYTFTNWTKDGTAVSTTASYTFTISGNSTLIANYTIPQIINTSQSLISNDATSGNVVFNVVVTFDMPIKLARLNIKYHICTETGSWDENLLSVTTNTYSYNTWYNWKNAGCSTDVTETLIAYTEAGEPTNSVIVVLKKPNTITYGTVSDVDGNTYKTVTIGTQVWMAENLKTSRYRNGDAIPNVAEVAYYAGSWGSLTTGAYCNYNNDAAIAAVYGKLYNWYAATDTRNIAPTGWHVPTDAEWTTLTTYLGGEVIAGGKLKETGFSHWANPNTGATNETGFTALPGGDRHTNNAFGSIGDTGDWWSSTEYSTANALERRIYHDNSGAYRTWWDKRQGISVRCVRD